MAMKCVIQVCVNKKQILEAKDLRCTLVGGNFHEEQ